MDVLLHYLSSAWSLVLFLIAFGFIIFVHELGHFLVAKAVGVKCLQFAIGMGHAVVSWRKGIGVRLGSTQQEYDQRISDGVDHATLGETEYRISWMPLGGYVKMLGQDDMDPNSRSDDPRALNNKPIWARACVFSAGVVMNIIFGILFFVIAFSIGVRFNAPVVGEVQPESPAAITYAVGHDGGADYQGLRLGDQIVSINGKKAIDLQQVRITTALAEPGQPITLEVERNGQRLTYPIQPEAGPGQKMEGLLWLGFDMPSSLSLPTAKAVGKAGLPRELTSAGVRPGMTIVAVDGGRVDTFAQYNSLAIAARGRPVAVTFADNDGKTVTVDVKAIAIPSLALRGDAAVLHIMGLAPPVAVGAINEWSRAERMGMKVGDIITQIGDAAWPALHDVPSLIADTEGPVAVTVLRDGQLVELEPTKTTWRGRLGFTLDVTEQPIVQSALPDSPAALLNLTPGSRILSVDGEAVDTLGDLQRILADRAIEQPDGFDVTVACQLNIKDQPVEQVTISIDRDYAAELAGAQWAQPLPLAMQMVNVKADGPIEAAKIGIQKTHEAMLQVYITLTRLFQRSIQPKHLMGPVGIIHTGAVVASRGSAYLLFFLGLLSANLAVINFLPIPIVDGGHIVFLIIEKIKGSPASERVQTAALYVGLALLLGVLAMTLYNDVLRIFSA